MTIIDNYKRILDEVRSLAVQYGRASDEITVVAVTKTHTFAEFQPLISCGCHDFGESRVQEALEKIALAPPDIHWHMIGALQKNKVNKVVGRFALIHSIESYELAKKISEVSIKENTITKILLQVNTSGEASKQGFSPAEVRDQFQSIQSLQSVKVEGLMTMAPFEASDLEISRYFAELRRLKDALGLKHLSMGMTHDYRIAIAEGATLLRIGTALFT